jgi:lipid II:glycine glycyltransferase (peptidoglycan interpeptide bridge formation enzyme)
MISTHITTKENNSWNERMLGTGLGTIFQSYERSEFFKKANSEYYFLKFLNQDKVIGQMLIQILDRFSQNNIKSRFFSKSPFLKKKICSWAYGPIIFDKMYTDEIFNELKKFLDKENYIPSGWMHPLFKIEKLELSKFQLKRWGTFLIDLSKSKETIYKNIERNSGRKNIQRSIKRGVVIEEITDNNLHEYFQIRNDYREEQGHGEANFERFAYKWKKYQPLGYSGFIAKKDKIPIGGLVFSFTDGHIIESGVARSKIDAKENLYSQDLIKWNIIEWGIKNKMKYYNLTGFNPNPESPKEEGIFRYKKKWGGERVQYYRIVG